MVNRRTSKVMLKCSYRIPDGDFVVACNEANSDDHRNKEKDIPNERPLVHLSAAQEK